MPQSAHLSDIGHAGVEAGDQIHQWFVDDEEGRRRLECYANPVDWFALLGPSRHGWFVVVDDEPVGLIDMEVNGERGYIVYYVSPGRRGLGYGAETVRLMADG